VRYNFAVFLVEQLVIYIASNSYYLMKKIILLGFILGSFCNAKAQSGIIIQLKSEVSSKQFLMNNDWGLSFNRTLFESLNIYLFDVSSTKSSNDNLLQQVLYHPLVENAMWDVAVETRNTPNDPRYGEQFALERIQAPRVWDISKGGKTANGDEIVVAIVDTDFSVDHEDLKDNIWINPSEIPDNGIDDDNNGYIDDIYGWNFGNNSNRFRQSPVHGVPVSGIIGAVGDNGIGITGINWKLKMLCAQYANSTAQIIQGYNYIAEFRRKYNCSKGSEGAFIVAVNSSFGLTEVQICEANNMWNLIQEELGKLGILSVNAAKNSPINSDEVGDIPSSCPSNFIISVLSTDINDHRTANSAFGKTTIDLGAPTEVLTTFSGNRYSSFGGTSAATPHVAGAVALLYSLPSQELADLSCNNPAAAALLVKDAILRGVDKNENLEKVTFSGGRLNIYNSARYLNEVLNSNATIGKSFKIMTLAPNPVLEELIIRYETPDFDDFQVKVINSLGQLVYKRTVTPCCFGETKFTINVNNWGKGLYFVVIEKREERQTASFIVI
jgi:hypothetical protein